MADVAVTMPGKHGDLMWTLPVVKEIAKKYGPVDFYVMPLYSSMLDLIQNQSYIDTAYNHTDWGLTSDSPIQPWHHPPLNKVYEKEYALGFRAYPHIFITDYAFQVSNIIPTMPILPFIESEAKGNHDVAIGFSGIYLQYPDYIDKFIEPYKQQLTKRNISWVDVSNGPWLEVAQLIQGSKIFIGDKSALHVLAHGLNKFVIEAESNPGRRTSVFTCPYGRMHSVDRNIIELLDDLVNVTEKQLEYFE